MSKICEICGKKPNFGNTISHAHNLVKRRWNPNLQVIRANMNGVVKKVKICTSCLKAGKVTKAAKVTRATKTAS